MYYKSENDFLTEQRKTDQQKYEVQVNAMSLLLEREKVNHAIRTKQLVADNERLLSERDGLRKQLGATKKSLRASSPTECVRRGEVYIDHLQRGSELAAQCAGELERKSLALTSCVAAYEDLRYVSGSVK